MYGALGLSNCIFALTSQLRTLRAFDKFARKEKRLFPKSGILYRFNTAWKNIWDYESLPNLSISPQQRKKRTTAQSTQEACKANVFIILRHTWFSKSGNIIILSFRETPCMNIMKLSIFATFKSWDLGNLLRSHPNDYTPNSVIFQGRFRRKKT